MRAHRPLAQSRHLRDLGVAELLDEVEPRHDALHLRQRLDGGVDAHGQLARARRQIGIVAAGGRLDVAQLFVPEALAMFDHVQCQVRHDSIDPRTEWLSRLEAADGPVRLDEGLLREVLGVVGVADDSPGDRHHPFHVF